MSQNRFKRQPLKKRIFSSTNFSVFLFVIIVAAFVIGVSMFSSSSVCDERAILERALNRDIVHCYAIEGFYPPSLEYMQDNYGLIYDEEKYLVDYEFIGSNIMPNVVIIERKHK